MNKTYHNGPAIDFKLASLVPELNGVPKVLFHEYAKELGSVQANFLMFEQFFPGMFGYEHAHLWVTSQSEGDYLDDGETKTPGTRLNFYWRIALGEIQRDAEYMDLMQYCNGKAIESVWQKIEFKYRNLDGRVRHTFTDVTVGKWEDESQRYYQDRIRHTTYGNIELNGSELGKGVALVKQVLERIEITKKAMEVVERYKTAA